MQNGMDVLAAADVLILEEIRKSRRVYLAIFLLQVILELAMVFLPDLFVSETIATLAAVALIGLALAFFITFLKAAAFALDLPSWLIFVIILGPRFVPLPGLGMLIVLALAVLVEVKIRSMAKSLKKQGATPGVGA